MSMICAPSRGLHRELSEALKVLNRTLIVFVDDFDRLTPDEAHKVVRLATLVADLPNVVCIHPTTALESNRR